VAGLLLGIAGLGWPTRVIGVRVAPTLVANRWRATRLARRARRLLARVGVPPPAPRSPDIVNGLGRGYGPPTVEGGGRRPSWEALARGPGMDLFDRNGVWPAARKAVIEYKAGAYPRDVLRIETTVVHRGTTSLTLRHVVRRVADDALIAEAEIVFVCVDRLGR